MSRVAMIGDVHGRVDKLAAVFVRLDNSIRPVILMGDLVNYGPDSKGVMDLVVQKKSELGEDLVILEGNHDRAFLDFLDGGDLASFLAVGGAPTVRSYLASPHGEVADTFRRSVPESHREILANTSKSWSQGDVLAIHQWPDERMPERPRFVVLGHYLQPEGIPTIGDHEAYIDTGCGRDPNGVLTCLLLPDREWFAC